MNLSKNLWTFRMLIVTVAITTVSIATVNLTTVTIETVIRSLKVLLGGFMIDSRRMADCYPLFTVGGGGVLLILSLPRGCYYLFYHPSSILLSHISSEVIICKVFKIYTLKYLNLKLKYKLKFSFNTGRVELLK